MQTHQELTTEIMKLVNAMADNSMIEAAILKALRIAYERGAESIRNSSDYSYREDMGR